MNHNFDPHELERVGNQSIKQTTNKPFKQAIQAVGLILLRLTLRSNKDTLAFYHDAPLLQDEDKYLIPRYLV
jgi:hypothetical protein